jgi:hypothetical protein
MLIMKEFMLIFSGPDYSHLGFSAEQSQAQFSKWYNWVEDLKKKGNYIEGRPLVPQGKTVKGKQPVVTDGPFAESKEIVGGYFIVNVPSIEEAVTIAKNCPDLDIGGQVEVREVMKM